MLGGGRKRNMESIHQYHPPAKEVTLTTGLKTRVLNGKKNRMNRQLYTFVLFVLTAIPLLLASCGVIDEDTGPLGASTIPSVSQIGETPHFEIYWSPVEDAAGYRLKRITPDGHQFMIDVGNVTHCQDTGMVPQVLYDESTTWVVKYDVCALDEDGNEGPWAGESQSMMYARPRQPYHITTDSMLNTIKISWQSSLEVSPEYNYFRFYRCVKPIEEIDNCDIMESGSLPVFNTDSLFAIETRAHYGNLAYKFAVTAVRYGVESPKIESVTHQMGNPPPPENLSFSYDTSDYTITIYWNNQDIAGGFQQLPFLSDSAAAGPFDSLDAYHKEDITDSSMVLTSIQRGIPYYVYLLNILSTSYQAYSAESETLLVHCGELVDTVPGAVTITKAYGFSQNTMEIHWSLVDGARDYRVYRKDSLSGSWEAVSDWIKPQYPVFYAGGQQNISVGEYVFYDEGAIYGQLYFYRVVGRNSYGDGIDAGSTSATTYMGNAIPPQQVEPSLVDTSEGAVTLNWDDPGNVMHFSILRSSTANRYEADVIADSLVSFSFTDTAAPPGDSAYYWIAAHGISETIYPINSIGLWIADTSSGIITEPSDSTGHLSLMVRDACCATALEDVYATLYGTTLNAVSDSSGNIILGYISIPKPDTTRLCTVIVSAEGYVTKEHTVEIEVEEFTFSPVQLVPQGGCVADTALLLTLSNSSNLDLDIHCLVPDTSGGSATDVGAVTGNLFRAPFARKFSGNPETIVISQLYEGTYTVYVRAWSDPTKPTIPESGATISVTDANGATVKSISASSATGTGDYWNVCTIDGATGQVTLVSTLSNQSP